MNDDPLFIIKQEIAEKRKESDLKIKLLNEKKANLINQIESFNTHHQKQIIDQKEHHCQLINNIKDNFIKQKNEIQKQFNIFTEKRNNQLLTDSLLENSNYEQKKQEIQKEIDVINQETQKFTEEKTHFYQSLLLPFQDSIEFDKMRIEEIQKEIDSLKNPKSLFNKVDKIRKGPKITPLDAKIVQVQHRIDDSEFAFNTKTEKLDKSFDRKKTLAEYEISKLRKSIKDANHRQVVILSKIEEEKSIHKIKMNNLKMELLDLTDPKPFPVPKRKKDRSKQIKRNNETSNELSSILESKNLVLIKLKEKQSDLLRKIRKLNWALSNPTDFTYSRSSHRIGIDP